MKDYSVGSMCSCTFGQRDYISSDPKRKAAQGMEHSRRHLGLVQIFNDPSAPGPQPNDCIVEAAAAWLLMSRVEAHLLPSLTIQRRASSQDCLPKTSVFSTEIHGPLVLSFIVSWSSKQVDLQTLMLIPSYKKKQKRFKMRAPRH